MGGGWVMMELVSIDTGKKVDSLDGFYWKPYVLLEEWAVSLDDILKLIL
jgi:hypothetical protein